MLMFLYENTHKVATDCKVENHAEDPVRSKVLLLKSLTKPQVMGISSSDRRIMSAILTDK